MAPTVILLRHAEALHNATHTSPHDLLRDRSMTDPELTPKGLGQAQALQQKLQTELPLAHDTELIVVSPFQRTLQTMQIGLKWLIERGVPVEPRADWQELYDKPCDHGSPVHVISEKFPAFDFAGLYPEWPSKAAPYWASDPETVTQRGRNCRAWLRDRPEKVIVVVSHGAFLRLGVTDAQFFENAQYRVYDFADDGSDALVERLLPVIPETGKKEVRGGLDVRGKVEFEVAVREEVVQAV